MENNSDSYLFILKLQTILCLLKKYYFFKVLFIYFERGREGERETNINVWLPLARPELRTWPETQVCALTGNRTNNTLICRLALTPLSHTSQG